MGGYRTWQPGEIITASNVQDYLQDQSVLVFASSSVRATAIPVPTEGMLSWLQDLNKYEYYTGAVWTDLVPAITGGTAGQPYVSNGTAAATFGNAKAEYIKNTIQNKSANYTVAASDHNTILNFTSAATVTVPDVFSVGDVVQVINNTTSGTVSLVAGTGVSSWAGAGTAGSLTFRINFPYTAAAVIKTAANEYRVIGRVTV